MTRILYLFCCISLVSALSKQCTDMIDCVVGSKFVAQDHSETLRFRYHGVNPDNGFLRVSGTQDIPELLNPIPIFGELSCRGGFIFQTADTAQTQWLGNVDANCSTMFASVTTFDPPGQTSRSYDVKPWVVLFMN